jgi:Fe-Mn family superoxide dismutase
MKYSEVEKLLRKELKLDEPSDVLKESYVAQPKKYTLNTESLRSKTKQAHNELYEGYVASLNQVSADLDAIDRGEANGNYSQLWHAKTSEIYNRNAVYLHEMYFANISDVYSEIATDSISLMRLNRDFGTFDAWQQDFAACAKTSCGWVVTALDMYLQRYVTFPIESHDVNIPIGVYPIIVLDMWEHARRDYLNNKAAYVESMMLEFNWRVIEERFKRADAILQVLR